jgi:hypothetical protein
MEINVKKIKAVKISGNGHACKETFYLKDNATLNLALFQELGPVVHYTPIDVSFLSHYLQEMELSSYVTLRDHAFWRKAKIYTTLVTQFLKKCNSSSYVRRFISFPAQNDSKR